MRGQPLYEYSRTEIKTPQATPVAEEPVEDVLKDAPWPVDKDNLPKKLVYQPRQGSIHNPPSCECHKQPIKAGQTVMFWPVPSGEIKVFCMQEDLKK
jgi:hypothetical protein